MPSLRELIRELAKQNREFMIGTVETVDESALTCTVRPEREDNPRLEHVSLRVYNLQEDDGVYVIPEQGSPVLVALLDGLRPLLLKVQTWEKIVLKTQALELTAYRNGDVELYTQGGVLGEIQGDLVLKVQGSLQLGPQGQHKAAWGDMWLQYFNQHTHPTPSGPSGPPTTPLQDQQVNSQRVRLD